MLFFLNISLYTYVYIYIPEKAVAPHSNTLAWKIPQTEEPGRLYTYIYWASLVAQMVKTLPAIQETWVRSLSWEDPLEKGMATHSGILAWRIPGMGESGGLPSMGSHRVGHD